jgi:hypothetical protein
LREKLNGIGTTGEAPYAHPAIAAVLLIGLCLAAPRAYAQSGPFAGMAGSGSGGGKIDLNDGIGERIRCRASYAVGGDGGTLQQQLRCPSDSYRFEVSSTVESRRGSLSGSWSEMTRNIIGQVSGRAAGGHIRARVDAGVFAADLTVNTSGNQQSVAIVPQGTNIRIVAVTMSRRAD